MYQSEQINELIAALAKAQGQIKPAIKDSINPHFRSKYADLGSVWEACREALSTNALAVVQTIRQGETGQELVTTLGHSSGQWMSSHMTLPVQKSGAQEIGSCLSYCRRYALASMVGVYSDAVDDDAELATSKVKESVRLPTLTVEQQSILEGFLKEFPESKKDMLNRFNVSDISYIPYDRFQSIVSVFEKKRKAKTEVTDGEG